MVFPMLFLTVPNLLSIWCPFFFRNLFVLHSRLFHEFGIFFLGQSPKKRWKKKSLCEFCSTALRDLKVEKNSAITKSHLRNWLIIIKLIAHRWYLFTYFFAICHADFDKLIKNSAWISRAGAWYKGQKIHQILQIWTKS